MQALHQALQFLAQSGFLKIPGVLGLAQPLLGDAVLLQQGLQQGVHQVFGGGAAVGVGLVAVVGVRKARVHQEVLDHVHQVGAGEVVEAWLVFGVSDAHGFTPDQLPLPQRSRSRSMGAL